MPFNSFRFVLYATAVLVLHNLSPQGFRLGILLAASVLFYADSSLSSVVVLVAISATAYSSAIVVESHRRKALVAISIGAIALPLLGVKYYALATQLLSRVGLIGHVSVSDRLLPLGISFYTFQAISYVVDVHRGVAPAERRFENVALYLAFFPKLLAGPIERARAFLPQLSRRCNSPVLDVYIGVRLALWGFFCKLVVADNVGSIVDGLLTAPQQQSGATLSIAFVLYSFQIYFDFLGYTSIAIGVARCFNVRLSRNFNRPYAATSLRDFWRRWHISLSSWFRDYVYIPLGGNATWGARRIGQVLTVFLISGLWHGAALNFVAWGGFHGTAYLLEEQARKYVSQQLGSTTGKTAVLWLVGQRVLTFAVVTMAWVFFRLSDFADICVVFKRMSLLNTDVPYGSLNTLLTRSDSLWFVLILLTAIVLDSSNGVRAALRRVPSRSEHVIRELVFVNWLVVTLVLLGDLGVRDFTYFRF